MSKLLKKRRIKEEGWVVDPEDRILKTHGNPYGMLEEEDDEIEDTEVAVVDTDKDKKEIFDFLYSISDTPLEVALTSALEELDKNQEIPIEILDAVKKAVEDLAKVDDDENDIEEEEDEKEELEESLNDEFDENGQKIVDRDEYKEVFDDGEIPDEIQPKKDGTVKDKDKDYEEDLEKAEKKNKDFIDNNFV